MSGDGTWSALLVKRIRRSCQSWAISLKFLFSQMTLVLGRFNSVVTLPEIWDKMADGVLVLHSKWRRNRTGKCMGKDYFFQITPQEWDMLSLRSWKCKLYRLKVPSLRKRNTRIHAYLFPRDTNKLILLTPFFHTNS